MKLIRLFSVERIVAITLFVFAISSSFAEEINTIRFNIPRQEADKALTEFARQANAAILFPSRELVEVTSNAVQGEFTIEEALSALLSGTNFQASYNEAGVLSVKLINHQGDEKVNTKPKQTIRRGLFATLATMLFSTGGTGVAFAQGDSILEEITVTGGKRTENVQDVPASVAVLNSDMLRDLGVDNGSDIAEMVAGVQIQEIPGLRSQFKVRGVGANDHAISTNPSVAVAIDDVYQSTNAQGSPQMFDVERVEVFKGPQGDLSGVVASGGVVSFVTKKPTAERDGYVKGGYGNFDRINVEAAYGNAITDNLAYRLAGKILQRDGVFDNVSTNPLFPASTEDIGNTDQKAVRGQLLWTATEDTEVLFNMHYARDAGRLPGAHAVGNSGPGCGINIDADRYNPNCITVTTGFAGVHPPEGKHTVSVGPHNQQDIDAHYYGGYVNVEHDFSFATLTSISAYEGFDQKVLFDLDNQPVSSTNLHRRQEYNGYSQEVRLNGTTDNMDWIVGATYGYENLTPNVLVYCGTITRVDPPQTDCLYAGTNRWRNLSAEAAAVPAPTGYRSVGESEYEKRTRNYAIFGNVQYAFNDDLKLIAGLRYTDVNVKYRGFGRYFWSDGSVFFNNQNNNGEAFGENSFDTTNVSGRVSLNWYATDNAMLYATYATGFKAGGFDGALASDVIRFLNNYEDETVTMVEVGFKSDLTDTIRLNAAAYYQDYQDVQARIGTTVFDQFGNAINLRFLSNLEEATIKGLEAELQWQAMENLYLTANVNFLDTEIGESRQLTLGGATLEDLFDGNDLTASSPVTASFYMRYDIPLNNGWGSYIQANASYSGESFHSVENRPLLLEDSYWKADARVGLMPASRNWSASLWVKNIADVEYGVNGGGGTTRGTSINFGLPRTFGVDVNYNF